MALEDLDLPSSDPVHWSPFRKDSLVYAVGNGTISLDEACERYQLSSEEFLGWQAVMLRGRFSLPSPSDASPQYRGLRVTRLQYHRDAPACIVSAIIWFGIAAFAVLILPFL